MITQQLQFGLLNSQEEVGAEHNHLTSDKLVTDLIILRHFFSSSAFQNGWQPRELILNHFTSETSPVSH